METNLVLEHVIELSKQFNDKIKELEEERKKVLSNLFTDLFAAFFEKYPFIGNIYWNQYTPYWNDGDECIFRVNELRYSLGGTSIDEVTQEYFYENEVAILDKPEYSSKEEIDLAEKRHDEDPYQWKGTFERKFYEDHLNIYNLCVSTYGLDKIKSFNEEFELLSEVLSENEETLKSCFGDHVKVIVTKEGTQVEEYQHD